MNGYPRALGPVLWSTLGGVWLSGLALVPTTARVRWDWTWPWSLGGESRVWVVALHVVAAMAMLGLIGALWAIHVRSGWRRRRHRASGTLLVSLWAAMALTAPVILYAGSEAWSNGGAGIHVGAGMLLPSVLWVHAAGRCFR